MIGIDIVNIEKFKQKANKHFINKLYSDLELSYAYKKENYIQTLAGIFAAKEAVIKANNLNLSAILRKKIEIKHIHDKPIAFIDGYKIKGDISISHDGDYTIAICKMKDDSYIKINSEMKNLMPKRDSDTHKGDYGRIAIVGGSDGMAGSVYISSMSSMRTGAGLCYILAPKSISTILQIKANEQIIREIDCDNYYYEEKIAKEIIDLLEDKDVAVIGPGMGNGKDLNKLIGEIILKSDIDIVIDADGLNALSKDLGILKTNNSIVLTPHLGEFSRLSNLSIKEIKDNEEEIARNFARKYNVILVLKSNHTIVTDGKNLYKNEIGNSGMATAGSGDVLTGVIATLMKQLNSFDAAKLGVYIHSLAGDIASQKLGKDSLIATDIVENISEAMKLMR